MGRLVPEKGLTDLLHAAALLKDSDLPSFQVLLVAAGPQEEELRTLAGHLDIADSVVFAGRVPHHQAGNAMQCMDIFVLPSLTRPNWKEQFGRVIVEALACHVPVIGSDSGQIPFLIRDTEGGLVFPEGNSKALAECLHTLLASANQRMQAALCGGEAVRRRYTYDAVAQTLHQFLVSTV